MRKILILSVCIAMALILCACGHQHVWTDATCTDPQTCTECGKTMGDPDPDAHQWVEATCEEAKHCDICGKTEGKALGHDWKEATCTEPKTCTRCKKTEGEALGHKVENWTQTKAPTCTETGSEEGKCPVCEQTVTREVAKVDHTPGDWEVTKAATENTAGIRVKKCTVCGKELESESFTLTPEEIKNQYISECQSIPYDSLARTPDDYKGAKVKMSGYVVQVCSEATSPSYYSVYRVATRGRYDNVVLLQVDNYGSGARILEDDHLTFYGTADGLYTYETVMGASVTIPKVTAKYVN